MLHLSLWVQTSALHVEKGVLIYVARRGAVAALYVVGEDQQAGLAVHFSIVGEEQVLVGLPGHGFLSVLADQHCSAENRSGFPI